MDILNSVKSALGGGVGGSVLMIIVSLIKNAFTKK